jgi:hypothetical protein
VNRAVGVVGGLTMPSAVPYAAGQWPDVAVGQDVDRAVLERRRVSPEARQPAAIGRRLEDDRVRLGTHRVGDRVTVLDRSPTSS